MPRFTVLGLFLTIVASAGIFAALRASNDYWAGGVQLVTLALIGVAIVRSVQGRAGWLGFLVFCGGYFVAIRSLPEREVDALPTSLVLKRIQEYTVPASFSCFFPSFTVITDSPATPPPDLTATPLTQSPPFDPSSLKSPSRGNWADRGLTYLGLIHSLANPEAFLSIGQNLVALLFGGLGAWFARRGQALRETAQAGSTQGS